MSSSPSRWIEFDLTLMEGSGVARFAIAAVDEVEPRQQQLYHDWICSGRAGEMTYLERYGDVRSNPALLLDGARSIICCAIPYYWPLPDEKRPLSIARYALGRDYHDVVRRRLEAVAERIRANYGGDTRVCVDTAPLRERYWAARAGLGFIGRNNQLIIPGLGSYFFLGEILTTAPLQPAPSATDIPADPCSGCDRCLRACPTRALNPDGSCDARRCLSYLTIEYRGDFPPGTDLHGSLYGCDRCAAACPCNARPLPTTIEEFRPNPTLLSLTADDVIEMTPDRFAATFRGSPMKRAKLKGLLRNALSLKD